MIGRFADSWACESGDTVCCKACAMLVVMEWLILFELFHDDLVGFIGERDSRQWFCWIRCWWGIRWYKRGHSCYWRSLLIYKPRIFLGGAPWWLIWLLWHPLRYMLSGCRWAGIFSCRCARSISALLCFRVWVLLFWCCFGSKIFSQLFNISCSLGGYSKKGVVGPGLRIIVMRSGIASVALSCDDRSGIVKLLGNK